MHAPAPLHVRWLGRVPYREALDVQFGIFEHGIQQHLLLLEHPHVFTYGPSTNLEKNLRCVPERVGADLVQVQRGGDITYHGPGQLVGYPLLSLPAKHGDEGPADTRHYVHSIEQLIIDVLAECGIYNAGRLGQFPGVWIDPLGSQPRKICAIGVRLGRGSTDRRTMHGFALNVNPDLTYLRQHIVPCGIEEYAVTSLAEEGVAISLEKVVDVVARLATQQWGSGAIERHDVAWQHR
ncbi:MAG: lipoyl(octanoyl) transferase LipB, partial [Ilumatobacteraceae bacterium]